MSRQKLQDRLKMKKVEPKHGDQFNDLLRYVFQVTNHDLQTFGWENREIAQAKLPVLKEADVLGWFDGDKLISQLAVYPFQVNIFGEIYDMGGLTGVGTYPEYANLGLMSQLMRQALANMRARKQSISYLYPYSIPFYRRKGWEIISDKISFEVKDTQLPKLKTVPGSVERLSIDHPDIRDVYRRFAMAHHGAMLRSDLAWEEYLRWDLDDLTVAVYYDEAQKPQGYLLYWLAEEVFHMKEMVFIDGEARAGLWNFISAHFSMITRVKGHIYTTEPLAFLLEDSDIKETISPYYMARIVDIHRFVKQYPFLPQAAECQLTFMLHDPMLEWNQGKFTLKVDEQGHGHLTEGGGVPVAAFDIQTLTTMLMGYKRPAYLARAGRFQAQQATIDQLEKLIDRQTPYFSDYF
ncbi:enhanced intracellular survival protein Eis [Paenibacillus thiaminolyticus]|uniref:GNAT family N-acetyltransferase n=1 Tax=Paenibacillus thiaminolyticus TaxID=49283 RepID=A0A3A3GGZ0_PANTH|nr:GNAT family N-acetyltransferase [Paenibacillus thiaminolyticus]RJG23563.1 GNAT family N-acetyltransferase [Paenibacillus thiaminolyticus]